MDKALVALGVGASIIVPVIVSVALYFLGELVSDEIETGEKIKKFTRENKLKSFQFSWWDECVLLGQRLARIVFRALSLVSAICFVASVSSWAGILYIGLSRFR